MKVYLTKDNERASIEGDVLVSWMVDSHDLYRLESS